MKITIEKQQILDNLSVASQFTSNRVSSAVALQGVLFSTEGKTLSLYATNLNSFFHGKIQINEEVKIRSVLDTRRLMEFVTLLPQGKVEMTFSEKNCVVVSGKTRGTFPLLPAADFPLPPKESGEEQKIPSEFLEKNLPLVLFSASQDEGRPVLTGVNFVTGEDMLMVSTDGFRLSYLKTKKEIPIPSVIIPASFLEKVIHFLKKEKELYFSYLKNEKMVMFRTPTGSFYSRLIDGDFPPFEKVIPTEQKTKATVDVDELIRNIKLTSVFAREYSSIVVLKFSKDGITIRPKTEGGEENSSFQEAQVEGDEQTVAFNFKFLLDFLSHIDTKTIVVELLRSDAPVVFKIPSSPGFLHIIMPVRIQE